MKFKFDENLSLKALSLFRDNGFDVFFVEHPDGGEKGCILEIVNALGETIDVITVPLSFVETLKADEILSVRQFSKAV